MIWHIDQESAVALAAVSDQPYCGLGRVTFQVSRAPAQSGADI